MESGGRGVVISSPSESSPSLFTERESERRESEEGWGLKGDLGFRSNKSYSL